MISHHTYIKDNLSHFASAIIVLCWIWLFRGTIHWAINGFLHVYDFFHLLMLIFVLFFIAYRFKAKLSKAILQKLSTISIRFQFKVLPFLITTIPVIGFLLVEKHWSINIMNATLMGISAYGLLGLFISSKAWIRNLVPAILILLTLPYGEMMDVYIGYPLRLIAAQEAHHLFKTLGIHIESTETILNIENSFSQIDMGCSGIKGLWSVWIFFFLISWLEKHSIGIRWLAKLCVLSMLILIFNYIRIILLITAYSVLHQPNLANVIHVPLGLLGFICSCIISWFWLKKDRKGLSSFVHSTRWNTFYKNSKQKCYTYFEKLVATQSLKANIYAQLFIISLLLTSTLFYSPLQSKIIVIPAQTTNWPAELNVSTLSLSISEQKYFQQEGASIIKNKFRYKNLSGSFILVFSTNWRAHHNPERCTQGNGLHINSSETHFIEHHFPLKLLNLNDSDLSACYWFQSPSTITEDFSSRIWKQLRGEENNWALVSILFDQPTDVSTPEFTEFVSTLKTQVDHSLKNL